MYSFYNLDDNPIDGLTAAAGVLKVVSFMLTTSSADLNHDDMAGLSDLMDAIVRDMECAARTIDAERKSSHHKEQTTADAQPSKYQRSYADGRDAQETKTVSAPGDNSTEMYRQGWHDGWDRCEANFRAELDQVKDHALRSASEGKTKPGAPIPRLTEDGNGEASAAKSA